jgi:hypothetical protein
MRRCRYGNTALTAQIQKSGACAGSRPSSAAGDLARGHFRRNGERVAVTDAPVQAEADRLYFLE